MKIMVVVLLGIIMSWTGVMAQGGGGWEDISFLNSLVNSSGNDISVYTITGYYGKNLLCVLSDKPLVLKDRDGKTLLTYRMWLTKYLMIYVLNVVDYFVPYYYRLESISRDRNPPLSIEIRVFFVKQPRAPTVEVSEEIIFSWEEAPVIEKIEPVYEFVVTNQESGSTYRYMGEKTIINERDFDVPLSRGNYRGALRAVYEEKDIIRSQFISMFSEEVTFSCAGETAVDVGTLQNNEVPMEFRLSQNFPNPFNSTTEFEYSIAKPGQVNISIFNLRGQQMAELVNVYQQAGKYRVTWNAGNLPSGVYLYKITVGEFIATKKMIFVK